MSSGITLCTLIATLTTMCHQTSNATEQPSAIWSGMRHEQCNDSMCSQKQWVKQTKKERTQDWVGVFSVEKAGTAFQDYSFNQAANMVDWWLRRKRAKFFQLQPSETSKAGSHRSLRWSRVQGDARLSFFVVFLTAVDSAVLLSRAATSRTLLESRTNRWLY